MLYLNVAVFLFYTSWLILSLVAQGTSPANRRIKNIDILHIIPNYKFFCPSPLQNDYHLQVRHLSVTNEWSAWQELRFDRKNYWYCYVWNPAKRERKFFGKAVKVIRDAVKKKRVFQNHPTCRALMYHIANSAVPPDAAAFQFRITARQDLCQDGKESIIYLSEAYLKRGKHFQSVCLTASTI
jgi:hypothetical protein